MASNPVSKGIGSGAAQVFDVSRMDRSMNKAFDTINAKKEAEEKARIAKKKLDDAGKGKLKGQFEDLDYSNVMLGDQKILANEVTEEMSRFDGHWGEILNGDPEWANKYRQSMAGLKAKINTSAISKPLADAQYQKMKEPDSGYSLEAIKNYEKLKAQPGYNHDEMLQSGALNRDQIIGSIFKNVDESLDSLDVFYDKKDSAGRNADKSSWDVVSKKWKSDEEALPIFRNNVMAKPSLIQDMNIQYGHLKDNTKTEEENNDVMMKAFYEEYKNGRQEEEKATNYTKAPEEDSTGGFGRHGDLQYRVKPRNNEPENLDLAGTLKDKEITLNTTGLVNGKREVVAGDITNIEYIKDDDSFYATVNLTRNTFKDLTDDERFELVSAGKGVKKDDWEGMSNEEKFAIQDDYIKTQSRGGLKKVKVEGNIANQILLKYNKSGARNMKELFGINKEDKSAAPSKGSVVGGYKFLGGDPKNQKNWKKI